MSIADETRTSVESAVAELHAGDFDAASLHMDDVNKILDTQQATESNE